jgi:glycosyltransferase involved in cell wall biosynthesis
MNILLITQFLSTTKGGGEYLFSVIANGLASRGHHVWIITHEVEDESYSDFHQNIKIIFNSKIKYEGGLPPSFSDNIRFVFDAMKNGYKIIKKENIELIHSNNFSPALAGSLLSTLTGISHITTVHDIFSLCGKNYWKMWGEQNNVSQVNVLLAPFFEKMTLRLKHSGIHTVSNATHDDLIKFGASKPIHIVNPAIKTLEYQEVKPNPLQFVYVGRLVFYKNLEILIRAVEIVKKNYPNIILEIVGGGPHKENLSELANQLELKENVKFCGYVSEEEKYRIISLSNAMVFPSLCEGFGLVILESFSCSRPVIVSDVKPLSDIVENSKDGLVVNSEDPKQWAEAIISLIKDEKKSLQMGLDGKKKLHEKYNQENMIDGIEKMYSDTLGFHA